MPEHSDDPQENLPHTPMVQADRQAAPVATGRLASRSWPDRAKADRHPDEAQADALLRHRIARLDNSPMEGSGQQADQPQPVPAPIGAAILQKRLEDLALDQVLTAAKALGTALRDIAYLPPSLAQPLVRSFRLAILTPVRDACLSLGDGEMRRAMTGPVRTAAELNDLLLDGEGEWLTGSSDRRLTDRLRLIEERALSRLLSGHPDLDHPTLREVMTTTARRIRWIEARDPAEPSMAWATRLAGSGRLDEVTLTDAASWDASEDILAALALRAGIGHGIGRLIMGSGDARAVTSLVWRAGLSMRFALLLQITAASGITPAQRLNARDGTDFPMTGQEMTRQLALYGAAIPQDPAG